ncbi:hypothetical protein BSPLISOX_724, partial [uncultured Gammaproteobacteria bacterium]
VADSQDNRKGHHGEDNNIYLNDANLNNTKDLATTLGHETSHAIDNQDPSIDTNPQNNASKADNEIYAQNYGDDFSDYVEFASENYGDGNLADSNNKNLGNTPAEIQRNQTLVNSNNQDYAKVDKSKGEDFLFVNQQIDYAREMTECGKNGHKCKNNIRRKYKKLYDKNRQEKFAEIKRELSKPPFLRNKYKTKQELESAIDLLNNSPFKKYIVKISEQSLNGVETTRTEEYVSGFEQKTKKDLKAVGDFGLSVYPPTAPYYNAAKFGIDGVKDYQNGNFDNTLKNGVNYLIPLGMRKIGIPKTPSNLIPAGIESINNLNNED